MWQAIETAPKDNSEISEFLVYDEESREYDVSKWEDGKSKEFPNRWGSSGFYSDILPTHWMPIPVFVK